MTTPRNYWMVAVSPTYYEESLARKFDLLGMSRVHRKRAQRMEIGDRILYYVHTRLEFSCSATVVDTFFEEDTRIWSSTNEEETYPCRVKTRPDLILDGSHTIDARLLAPRLEYVRKWAPEWWTLAFQGLLHLVPKKDFLLVEDEMVRGHVSPAVELEPDPRHGPRAREAQITS